MQNIRQTTVSLQVSARGPVELSFDELQHVAGGLGPNDSWATATVALGPNDNWATVPQGPNDNW